jgi:hypothetical protein
LEQGSAFYVQKAQKEGIKRAFFASPPKNHGAKNRKSSYLLREGLSMKHFWQKGVYLRTPLRNFLGDDVHAERT